MTATLATVASSETSSHETTFGQRVYRYAKVIGLSTLVVMLLLSFCTAVYLAATSPIVSFGSDEAFTARTEPNEMVLNCVRILLPVGLWFAPWPTAIISLLVLLTFQQ